MNDLIADALIRIKNGYLAGKDAVDLPYSKLVFSVSQVLKEAGYLSKVEEGDRKITVTLKYDGKSPVLTDVKRISKPGLRVYKGKKELPRVLGGLGVALVSTPKGVMTADKARKEGVGGEILAYVW
ncbi:MAG: 30S ribosomal protein S8 [Candidatus Daviesbacteria bacterium GW2011_GWA2_38_24]|uniref:Small ribosomal subunit protein uS8 n=1 Tax=Candidatus Daviesbacteria bacterium GW2011_GWA2_38_24 TaxID=1618422 RepID=A0A0G0JKM4_9BACT|nr:MAG: 30S ribosomal protein S8 [Candidatus Daviesbacteria bacterium GW2011_GWA2_38_24]OGE24519.1 MAG: 30S ribosomal protein S8 [Candidatus Daviesbacteria bacterium RIFCSPHIGHO2_01_FULL_38_8]